MLRAAHRSRVPFGAWFRHFEVAPATHVEGIPHYRYVGGRGKPCLTLQVLAFWLGVTVLLPLTAAVADRIAMFLCDALPTRLPVCRVMAVLLIR